MEITITKQIRVESYSRGRRGVPAKDVGVERRARVQIPHSPPRGRYTNPAYYIVKGLIALVVKIPQKKD